jgi:hypothetical protein
MGIWGYKTLQNDYILSELGGYNTKSEIVEKLEDIIAGETDYRNYSDILINDIVGLLSDSYGTPEYISEQKVKDAVQELKTLHLINKGCLCKDTWAWLSVCTIPVEFRNDIFKRAIVSAENNIKFIVDNQEMYDTFKKVLQSAKKKYNTELSKPILVDSNRLHDLYRVYHGKKPEFSTGHKKDTSILILKCIQKIKHGNKIVAYKIQDLSGNTKVVSKEQLVGAVKNNLVKVNNLTIYKDSLY